ncbi:MAG: circularly permuted type 2 ATP-grasp protein, partial [Nitrospiraceae bacterium]
MPGFMRDLFTHYGTGHYFDEMFEASDQPRPHYRQLYDRLGALSLEEFLRHQSHAALAFLNHGITFTVYG